MPLDELRILVDRCHVIIILSGRCYLALLLYWFIPACPTGNEA